MTWRTLASHVLRDSRKRNEESFGDAEKDYRLGNIFYRPAGEFEAADAEAQKLQKEFDARKDMSIFQRMLPLMSGAPRQVLLRL